LFKEGCITKKNAWIGIVIVVIVLIAGGYAIFHKSPKPAATTTTSKTAVSNPGASASTVIIQTKTSSSVGQYLADSSGDALYTYGADTQGVSNCSGSCIAAWPVYKVTNTTATLPANVTIITRSDGTKQYAYKGLPLYTFTGDSSGQVTGNGVNDFSVAKP